VSYHASGQHHYKSFGQADRHMIYHYQPPDQQFRGSENAVRTRLTIDDARAFNTPCKTADYDQVLEIDAGQLSTTTFRNLVVVDLTEPNAWRGPATPPILKQMVAQDAIPWIVVTVFGT
jgi:hypothetical protein